ncbi:hypothetical protein BDK51DRAFT_33821 [Blyttiomyces helicus]|uniref:Uncharacterized protein n=1 Tax=Blyttiomyces helicus TaxID=388810 RepID=A0A4V1IPE5_9FUNG|nr:hypothetical protein BDK51DRAFT_33821 [Blyttiomyces helicus]|eukprot:RKO82777.1 hypothetical protein BDK51DRAFT_33821 [Blyttiomyces helicus]
MSQFLGAYSRFLTNWRYASQSVTAGALWFTGDLISQKFFSSPEPGHSSPTKETSLQAQPGDAKGATAVERRVEQRAERGTAEIDWRRVGIMTAFGVCISGPAYTFWYRLLDERIVGLFKQILKKKTQSTTTLNVSKSSLLWKITLAKVGADMIMFDPAYLALFFTSTHLLSGNSLESGIELMKREILPTYLVEVAVWTPVQLLNFRFVPLLYQPVVVNSVNVGWNAYLSYVKHREGSGHGHGASHA